MKAYHGIKSSSVRFRAHQYFFYWSPLCVNNSTSSGFLMALLQVLACERLPRVEWIMEGVSITIFVTVQKIYYPLLCIMGIPGLQLVRLFGLWLSMLEQVLSGIISTKTQEEQPDRRTAMPSYRMQTGNYLEKTSWRNCRASSYSIMRTLREFGRYMCLQTHIQIKKIDIRLEQRLGCA